MPQFAREELATAEARAQGVEQRYKQLEARLTEALNTARSAIRHARQQQQLSNRNQANAEAALGHAFRSIGIVPEGNSSSNQTTPDLHDYRNLEKRAQSARAEAGRALDRASGRSRRLGSFHRVAIADSLLRWTFPSGLKGSRVVTCAFSHGP